MWLLSSMPRASASSHPACPFVIQQYHEDFELSFGQHFVLGFLSPFLNRFRYHEPFIDDKFD